MDKALAILLEEEQMVLSLSFVDDKSSWQGGEIMGKAHYKFLEIKGRAERFFKLFMEYFGNYPDFFPKGTDIPNAIMEYFHGTIIERKKPNQVIPLIGDPLFKQNIVRTQILTTFLWKMRDSHIGWNRDFYELIIEFDRWNNFRILPVELQEPSAFKRRNKVRDLKGLKHLYNISPYVYGTIIERYQTSIKRTKYYIPLISKEYDDPVIMRLGDRITPFNDVTRFGLYIFKDIELAKDFWNLVWEYFNTKSSVRNKKTPTIGQNFWPVARVMMEKAVNYKDLNNLVTQRRYRENAIHEVSMTPRKKKKVRVGASRVKDTNLW